MFNIFWRMCRWMGIGRGRGMAPMGMRRPMEMGCGPGMGMRGHMGMEPRGRGFWGRSDQPFPVEQDRQSLETYAAELRQELAAVEHAIQEPKQ